MQLPACQNALEQGDTLTLREPDEATGSHLKHVLFQITDHNMQTEI